MKQNNQLKNLDGDINFEGLIPSNTEADADEFMLSLNVGTIFSSKCSMAIEEMSRSSLKNIIIDYYYIRLESRGDEFQHCI